VIVERVRHNGHIVITETVTDGVDTWMMTEQFIDYTEAEARELFAAVLAEKNLRAIDA
jgi:hypothetical protein